MGSAHAVLSCVCFRHDFHSCLFTFTIPPFYFCQWHKIAQLIHKTRQSHKLYHQKKSFSENETGLSSFQNVKKKQLQTCQFLQDAVIWLTERVCDYGIVCACVVKYHVSFLTGLSHRALFIRTTRPATEDGRRALNLLTCSDCLRATFH